MSASKRPELILVLGMHRSGTSLCTSILGLLGADLGDSLLGAAPDNPRGYWEDGDVVELHERLLAAMGRDWHQPQGTLPYLPEWWRSARVQPFRRELIRTLEEKLSQAQGTLCIKDPRVARLLPLWKDAASALSLTLRPIVALRDPREVIASVVTRNRMPVARAALIWLQHNLDIVRHAAESVEAVVDYGEWFRDPVPTARRIQRALGLHGGGDDSELATALARVVEPTLRHHEEPPAVDFPFVSELYDLMRSAPAAEWPERTATMRAALSTGETLLADWAHTAETLSTAAGTADGGAASLPPARIAGGDRPPDVARSSLETWRRLWDEATVARVAPISLPTTPPRSGLRVCIVTPDLAGWTLGRDAGIRCAALAALWAQAGYRVTVLLTRPSGAQAIAAHGNGAELLVALGVAVQHCPDLPVQDGVHDHVARSYRAYRWLRGQTFDLVYFVDWLGGGFHAVLAKHLGLAFEQAALVVGAQSPTLWQAEGNRRLLPYTSRLQTDHLERFSVAHADAVVAPGPQLLDWMQQAGWSLPARVLVQPHPSALDGRRDAPVAGREGPIREIVYFGRLEPRAGLMLFCQALSRLPPETAACIEVTFLGSAPLDADDGPFDAQGHVERNARQWPFEWRIVAGLSHEEELAYLDAAGRLAVIPAVGDSLPTTVGGCLARRLPFIASRACDIPDMIDAADRDFALFDPTPSALADRLAAVVAGGTAAPRPALAPSAIDQGWVGLPALAATWVSLPPQIAPAVSGEVPEITVCLIHRNRPDTLAQALDGLRRQTFRPFDVVLVDDGSNDPAALAALDGLAPEFERRGWTLVRQANRYLGAARNAAWRQARGHYVLFHDDDNVAMPHQLETYYRAAERAGADVLTCATVPFSGLAPPAEHDEATNAVWLPIGAALAGGAYENVFGDAQALVRREVLATLGGFSEDFGVGHEDWELFARAALAGYRVLTVPEPLFWYRVSEDSMLRTRVDDDADHLRSARPYLALLPPQLRPMLWLAISNARRGAPVELLQYQNGLLRNEQAELRQRYGELEGKMAAIDSALRDALLEVRASHSMRLTRPLRNLRNRLGGRPIETAEVAPSTPRTDLAHLLTTYRSLSWDLAAPLRLVRRLTRR